jgi:hypothetical protein
MKRTILLGIMLFSLIACEKSDNDEDNTPNTREYPSLPVYLQPADNDSFPYQQFGTMVTFKWNVCSDPQGDPVVYDLFVDGTNQYYIQSLNATEDSLQFSYGHYTWYVTARDNHGNFTQGPSRTFFVYY